MNENYKIRQARVEELPAIADIEAAAVQLFVKIGYTGFEEDRVPLETLEAAQRLGHVWVAADQTDKIVGFALISISEDDLHLEEVDIHPDHAHQGLGKAIIDTVCSWAIDRGVTQASLTTFREVPWNAPYYARLGFQILPEENWTSKFCHIIAAQAEAGIPVDKRVVMVKALK